MTLFMSLAAAPALMAAGYAYLKPDQLKDWLERGRMISIADLQPEDDFSNHSYKDSVWVGPYGEKNESAKARLSMFVNMSRTNGNDIVIVSSNGGEDALSAAKFLTVNGIDKKRILILENGILSATIGEECACCRLGREEGDKNAAGTR